MVVERGWPKSTSDTASPWSRSRTMQRRAGELARLVEDRPPGRCIQARTAPAGPFRLRTGCGMAKKSTGFERVRVLGRSLADVEEGTAWRTRALKTSGQMFACIPTHKSAEPDSLAVRIDFDQRDELIAADPRTYYVKEHYVNYPCVLVRLARIPDDALRDLLRMAHEFVRRRAKRSPKPKPRRRQT